MKRRASFQRRKWAGPEAPSLRLRLSHQHEEAHQTFNDFILQQTCLSGSHCQSPNGQKQRDDGDRKRGDHNPPANGEGAEQAGGGG
jgi:hypothetical protein